MSAELETEGRYCGGRVFDFPSVGLTLDLSGFPAFDNSMIPSYSKVIERIKAQIQDMESGGVVNTTETRRVDHYNLRREEPLMMKETEEEGEGGPSVEKSLSASLALWEAIKRDMEELVASGNYSDVIFNGIGGSILGPKMMVIALRGQEYFYELPIRLHFQSNTDSDSFHELMSRVDVAKTVMVTMSKSGGTAETMTAHEVFNDKFISVLEEGGHDIGEHNICVTMKGSNLDQRAQEKHFKRIYHMFEETGGRTSIGSAIGMIPAAFTGLDFAAFLRGQSAMDVLTRNFEQPESNPAYLIALCYDCLQRRRSMNLNLVVLGYSDYLSEFAHYLQQLCMESLGKKFSCEGVCVMEGQTVFGGIGTGEQHAFMQQIQRGVSDCIVRFLYFLKRSHDFPEGGIVKCGSMGRQLLGFLKGTEHALAVNRKPYVTTTFLERDMFHLGAMIALEERIVSILAVLKRVNAYDQPGVQLGKLSAVRMNQVSRAIEDALAGPISPDWGMGTPSDWRARLGLEAYPLYFVGAVLMDIWANVDVEGSFSKIRGKIRVNREFRDSQYFFEFVPIAE